MQAEFVGLLFTILGSTAFEGTVEEIVEQDRASRAIQALLAESEIDGREVRNSL
jgi:hypothetical protein